MKNEISNNHFENSGNVTIYQSNQKNPPQSVKYTMENVLEKPKKALPIWGRILLGIPSACLTLLSGVVTVYDIKELISRYGLVKISSISPAEWITLALPFLVALLLFLLTAVLFISAWRLFSRNGWFNKIRPKGKGVVYRLKGNCCPECGMVKGGRLKPYLGANNGIKLKCNKCNFCILVAFKDIVDYTKHSNVS